MPRERRSFYGGRHAHDAPLAGRRVWDVGDWGNASGYIGRRWELVGAEHLRQRLIDGTLPPAAGRRDARVVSFVEDEAIQRRLAAVGLTNADALLLLPDAGRVIARSVDFKWSIETATDRQVAAVALEALIERLPALFQEQIRGEIPGLEGTELLAEDGFFFSPRSRANDLVRQGRGAPRPAVEVVFEPVDGRAFFSVLPGWAAACQLAELDRRSAMLDTIDGAEHYYRLGVGISAARSALGRSIFETAGEAPPPDAAPLPLAEWGLRDTAAIVAWFSPRMAERRALSRRLRDVLRLPYSLRDLLRELAGWNPTSPDPAAPVPVPTDLRVRWEPLLRRLADRHRAAVLEEGLLAIRNGVTEDAAIDQLARRRGQYQQRARRWAGELT